MADACWRMRMRLASVSEPSVAIEKTSTSQAVRLGTYANFPDGSICKARGEASTAIGELGIGVSAPLAPTAKIDTLLDPKLETYTNFWSAETVIPEISGLAPVLNGEPETGVSAPVSGALENSEIVS